SSQRRVETRQWPDPDDLGLSARQADAPDAAQTSGAASSGRADTKVSPPNTGVAVSPEAKQSPAKPEAEQATIEGAVIPAPPSDPLARKFSQRAKDYPQDLSAQLDDELLRFLRDEPVPDVQAIAGLAAEDRELVSAIMDSLTNFRSAL